MANSHGPIYFDVVIVFKSRSKIILAIIPLASNHFNKDFKIAIQQKLTHPKPGLDGQECWTLD